MQPVKIGLLGLGTVGGGTVSVLTRNADEIARRAGRDIQITLAAAKEYDAEAIVIGGGHNGLICAAYLAKAGVTTILVEARDSVGDVLQQLLTWAQDSIFALVTIA